MKKFLFIIVLIGFAEQIYSQHEEVSVEHKKKNKISVLIGNAFISRGVGLNEERKGQMVPTFGLDYARRLSKKFSLGLFTDIELTSYFIERDNETQLKRENAFVAVLVCIYEVLHQWSLEAGYGVELERNESFQVLRLSTSYEVPIRRHWDVSFGVSLDVKQEYSSWSFAIGFGKSF